MQDILQERCTSNKLIDEAMSEARKLSSKALEMMRDANLKTMEGDNQIISKRSKMSPKIQEEQLFHSRESTTLRRKLVNTIDKQLHKERIKKMNAKVSVVNNECAVSHLE